MPLSRADILAAVKINRLLDHVDDPGSTPAEAAAYRRKALQIAKRYENAARMSRLADREEQQ